MKEFSKMSRNSITTRFLQLLFICLLSSCHSLPQDDYLASLKEAAKSGNKEAQNDLGGYYFENQEFEEAFEWFQKSAEQDYIHAYHNLGICYVNGIGTKQDVAKAIENYTKAAEKGNGNAALTLGYLYKDQLLECFDSQKSIHWFEQAAKHNIAQADFEIGNLYHQGDIVEHNEPLAMQHFQQAAYHGNAPAQLMLGLAYRDGVIVPRDYNLSIQWLKKSADQGLMEAQSALSTSYFYGLGIEQDHEMARFWQDKANEQRSLIDNADLLNQIQMPKTASKKIAIIEPLGKDKIKTEADSLYQRGFQLLFGSNTTNFNKEGIDCLTQATLKGNRSAKILLSYCFATGYGVYPSKVAASRLFVGKGQIKYSIGKECYTIDFEIFEDGNYEKSISIDIG